jgi:hypothetical protein
LTKLSQGLSTSGDKVASQLGIQLSAKIESSQFKRDKTNSRSNSAHREQPVPGLQVL